MEASFTSFRDSGSSRITNYKAAANKAASKKERKHKIKKSGVRTKFLIESLRQEYFQQREENEWLRQLVQAHLPSDKAEELLASCFDPNAPIGGNKPPSSSKELDDLAAKMMPGLNVQGDSDDDDMSDNEAVGF